MLLSQPGIDVNIQNRGRVTALHVAAWKGHEGIVELLLKQPNINVNIPDRDENTALHLAVYEGHTKIVEWLLDKEANPNIQDQQRNTALHKGGKGIKNKDIGELIIRI